MIMTSVSFDKNMDSALDAIMTRTSVRVYDPDKTVPDDVVEKLLRAGMAAPSAVNRQPWAFVVVKDRAILDALAEALPYAKMLAHAPLAIIPCGDSAHFLPGEDDVLWVQDLSAVSENILVAANALGLGAVWTCIYPHSERENPVRKILGIPESVVPFAAIPVGYPAHDHKPKNKWHENLVHYNHW